MKLKTLTLLILTAVVMASVACGPSAEELHQQQKELIQEQKRVMLCEDALERRKHIFYSETSAHRAYVYHIADNLGLTEDTLLKNLLKDIDKYCKD